MRPLTLGMAWLVGLTAGWPRDAEPNWNAQRAGRLAAKLRDRRGARIVVLGDSLTSAMGLSRRDGFPMVLERVLRERYRDPDILVIPSGVPGETSAGGLRRFDEAVASRGADLVVLQYGGNDHGWGRKVEQYRRDLAALVDRVRADTHAACIVCAPPMTSPRPMSPFVRAAVEVANTAGVPVADFDSAIRRGDHDFRGPFPHGEHPAPFTHAIMAKELHRAFDDLIGVEPTLSVTIEGGQRFVRPGGIVHVRVEAGNDGDAPEEGVLLVDWNGLPTRRRFDLAPGQRAAFACEREAPDMLAHGKSVRTRMMAIAIARDRAAFDVKWITFAPVLGCDEAEEGAAVRLPHTLGPQCVELGLDEWQGPADLSATFEVGSREGRLETTVTVRDDDVAPHGIADAPFGDAVELYIDARPGADRGRPVYDDGVLCLFVLPRVDGEGRTEWGPLDPPAPREDAIWATGERLPDGYAVTASVSLDLLRELAGGELSWVGFDVGVDDADGGGNRETQMMWAGTGRNFVDASMFAALTFGPVYGERLLLSIR
ncbi:MAG: GDSL-type esterase/lipase family protein [Armatimonadota bacterium]